MERAGMLEQLVRSPLLIPRAGGDVDFHFDGVLASGDEGKVLYAGSWSGLKCQLGHDVPPVRQSDGVMMPPLLDIHTHVPQHPIRGHFTDGVPDDAPGGKLLNGLQRNVFPAEMRCDDPECAERVVREFLDDTLSHGVAGGACYVTPSPAATEIALKLMPETWLVGLVMMNQNCPTGLRTREATFEADVERLAKRFGRRLIITDRFAVAVDTSLRRRGAALAKRFGLRTQTHLNEQPAEKSLVEKELYPDAASYTDVYRCDGLLDHACIAAHCIHMREEEWAILRDTGSVIAHCPTSNLLLDSGRMSLDTVTAYGIPYAIATDVGASPTVSMLAEMNRFVSVHKGHSARATPSEALYRATRAPAEILGLGERLGRLEAGRPMSFIEVGPRAQVSPTAAADDVVQLLLRSDSDPSPVRRVTLDGRVAFENSIANA
jgi:guanine deaminase